MRTAPIRSAGSRRSRCGRAASPLRVAAPAGGHRPQHRVAERHRHPVLDGEDDHEAVEVELVQVDLVERARSTAPACAATSGRRRPTGTLWVASRVRRWPWRRCRSRSARPAAASVAVIASAIACAWATLGARCGATTTLRCLSGACMVIIRVCARKLWMRQVGVLRLGQVAVEGGGQRGVGDHRGHPAADRPGGVRRVGEGVALPQRVAAGDDLVGAAGCGPPRRWTGRSRRSPARPRRWWRGCRGCCRPWSCRARCRS